jgi:hypothetical protein
VGFFHQNSRQQMPVQTVPPTDYCPVNTATTLP